MITDDEVMRVFERADPAGSDDGASLIDAVRYLDALCTRDSIPTSIEPTPVRGTATSRYLWLTVAAAAVVAALIVAGVLQGRDDTSVTVAANRRHVTAVHVATGFVDAYGVSDTSRVMTYLADDADLSGMITSVEAARDRGGPEAFRLTMALLRAEGYKQAPTTCKVLSTSATGTTLRCPFAFQLLRSDEIGLGPFNGSYFDLTVRDRLIVRAAQHWETNEFSPQVWEPFANWVSKAHPQDVAVMYTDATSTLERLTPQSIRLWDRRTREYAARVTAASKTTAKRFVAAYGALDAERATSFLADDAYIFEMVSVFHRSKGTRDEFRLLLSLLKAQRYQQTFKACERLDRSVIGITFHCTFSFQLLGSEEIGRGSFRGGYFDLTVRDGEIVRASQRWDLKGSPWKPFARWVSKNFPEDVRPCTPTALRRDLGSPRKRSSSGSSTPTSTCEVNAPCWPSR